ncbi:hypothetical protein [Nostoc sp. DSM 114160]
MMKLPQTIPVLLFGASLAVISPQHCAAFTVQQIAILAQASSDLPMVKSAGGDCPPIWMCLGRKP